jgi:hypothetical protein
VILVTCGTSQQTSPVVLGAAGARSLRAVPWRSLTREVVLIGVGGLLYSLVRGLSDDRVAQALANAESLIEFERRLGIHIEPGLQAAVVDHQWAVDVANAVYIAYWPIVFGTAAWLLIAHRPVFALYRNALLISGALGLVAFASFPLAPPRFLDGFVDTIAAESDGYRRFNASALVNEYAAMPSLHFGWVLLVGIAIASLAGHRMVRAVGMALPVLMLAAIVLTGNHFLLDAAVGGVVVLAGLAIARWLRTRFGSPSSELW